MGMRMLGHTILQASALGSLAFLIACDHLTCPTTIRVVGVMAVGDPRAVVLAVARIGI